MFGDAVLPPGGEVTAGRQADITHNRGQLPVQLLAEEVAPVKVLQDRLAVDEDAPLARQVVLTLHNHTHVSTRLLSSLQPSSIGP